MRQLVCRRGSPHRLFQLVHRNSLETKTRQIGFIGSNREKPPRPSRMCSFARSANECRSDSASTHPFCNHQQTDQTGIDDGLDSDHAHRLIAQICDQVTVRRRKIYESTTALLGDRRSQDEIAGLLDCDFALQPSSPDFPDSDAHRICAPQNNRSGRTVTFSVEEKAECRFPRRPQ
jgi:hypothetical protein